MNVLHIIGNLTADPKGRVVNTQSGEKVVCDLNIATNRYVKGQKTAEYFRATLWGNAADNALKYLTKGRKVAVTGPVEGRVYEGGDGQYRCSLEIRQVREIEYLGGGRQGETEPFAPPMNESATMDDDELPF